MTNRGCQRYGPTSLLYQGTIEYTLKYIRVHQDPLEYTKVHQGTLEYTKLQQVHQSPPGHSRVEYTKVHQVHQSPP